MTQVRPPSIAAPHALEIDYGGDQFPVSGERPRLSWRLRGDAEPVAGYDLRAVIDDIEHEATLPSSAHLLIDWPWADLVSRQRVTWQVRARTADDAGEWSPLHTFEAGLFDADWRAQYISPPEAGGQGGGRHPAYRLATSFTVSRPVQSARLYSTALGVYESFVNDERAGSAELSPGSTSYDRTLYAQAADVTPSIRHGSNELSALLSDGWYRGQVGAFRLPAGWGDTLAFRAQLHLRFDDGTETVILSDGSWTASPSVVTRADLMDGQSNDYSLDGGAPAPVLVDAVSAPAIDWSPAPPIRRVESRPPLSVTAVSSDRWIVDFGQNASGWIRLTDLGSPGTRTSIDYGEHLGPDGDLTTAHLDAERPGEPAVPFVQHDEIVAGASPDQVFEPRHTVHGFQYARIRRVGAPLVPEALTMQVVHTDLPSVGTFESSNHDLNRLHEIARWSFRGNAVDVPTDCPTRERLGWTGDYQVFAPTAVRLYDVSGFTRKWLRSVRDDQLPDGRIANFSPDGRRIKAKPDDQLAMMTGSAGWGDAIVSVPWLMYETYGDRQVLAENWDAMRRWVEWSLATAASSRHPDRVARSSEPLPHERYIWDGSFHWGEWLEPKARAADGSLINPIQSNPMAWFMADKGEVGTAFLYRSTSTVAAIAATLGRDDDAARYRDVAERVRDAWRAEFLDASGRTAADTQASYVRALAFGLVPQELRDVVAERLVELIRQADLHLGTGFLSTADLLPVLADTGHPEIAYQVLLQRTSPSWLGMLDRGATTIWEDWDGIDDDGVAHESLNHYSKGAVIRFLHTHTLGLTQAPGSVAWESFVVAPFVDESIEWARGSFDSPQGRIDVGWEVGGGQLTVRVEVPPGTRATLRFPDGSDLALTPGFHVESRPLP